MNRADIASLVATALLSGCQGSPTGLVMRGPQMDLVAAAAVASPGQSATGHVEHDFTQFGVPLEKYSFSAVNQPDGSVAGQFEVRDVFLGGSQTIVHGVVTCLTILADGKTARVGGLIDTSNDATLIGRGAFWTVIDNGDGTNGAPDDATDLRFNGPPDIGSFHCSTGINLATLGPNMRGNVQVRP